MAEATTMDRLVAKYLSAGDIYSAERTARLIGRKLTIEDKELSLAGVIQKGYFDSAEYQRKEIGREFTLKELEVLRAKIFAKGDMAFNSDYALKVLEMLGETPTEEEAEKLLAAI